MLRGGARVVPAHTAKKDSVDMTGALPLYFLATSSALICTATGAPHTGGFRPKVCLQQLCDHKHEKYCAAGVTRARLSAQALQTQVLMSMRATPAEALAWARSLAAQQGPWCDSWLSVTCWPFALNVAQMRGMRLRHATVSAPSERLRCAGACAAGKLPNKLPTVHTVQPILWRASVPDLPAAPKRGERRLLWCALYTATVH